MQKLPISYEVWYNNLKATEAISTSACVLPRSRQSANLMSKKFISECEINRSKITMTHLPWAYAVFLSGISGANRNLPLLLYLKPFHLSLSFQY